MDIPGGPVVKNLPANAGDMGSIPGGEDPTCHRATKPTPQVQSLCTLEPALCNKRSHHSEKPAHQS